MFTTRPELAGDFGMVASTHWLASATGMSVLERGGNAADAAVAAGFVLQVVEPHLNGPGGEVPVLLWDPGERRVSVVCGQGVAPAAATGERLLGLGLSLVPGTGLLPTVVPGSFGAWLLLLERWGTWSLADVLAPAIHYADRGHPLLGRVSTALGTVADMFRAHWPTSAATWLPGGAVPAAGSRFTNPVLAGTWRRLVAEGEAAGGSRERRIAAARDAWYRGFVAEAIGSYCATAEVMDTSGRAHGGLLTADDLAAWQPAVEEPATFDYHGYTVCKTGPWGQGPVFLQQLALLEGFDLAAMGPGSADWVHTVIEAGKLAFADREAWYGDPDHTDVPLDGLLDPEYTAQRRRLITGTASLDLRPGSPGGRSPRLPRYPQGPDVLGAADGTAGAGEPTLAATGEVRGDTCHLDVADRHGMMISATPSGGWFQSSPTVPELGFCLSTRGQMFWVEPGLPNSLRPGARPRTTLTPSFALRDGEPWLAFGTPGGDFQDQWSLHFFLNAVHGGMNLQEAIDAPEFHTLHVPNSFYPRDTHPGHLLLEERFDPDVLAELRRRGHRVETGDAWSLGHVSAVAREDGWLRAAANPRGNQGYAVGR
ncbi:gamma-glutamyltranspeptidase [Streptomyces sulfonofaciens]|uniref:Gamma-glutamyltranspeptidase n=1 Tax=Streptomyces sulfonofaciens TaxID=68272 RepID=A0A919FT86_9ACTN|nr:gamma-glutamyltransferase family protein [Streptomyces sulfonofaciens]GHH71918.1 gamma-glutamyltranspeptidase [Streptomyces sulfonofaciens]